MIPDTLRIGPIPIHLFGIFVALACIVAGWIVRLEFVRRGQSADVASNTMVAAIAGGLVGARVWAAFHDWANTIRDPIAGLITNGGLVWYGGLAGGAIAVTLYFQRRGIPWLEGADALAPALALGHAIGRIGCQVSGDGDWGTETKVPWGMAYPYAVAGWDKAPGVRVHPTPIYEMLAYAAIFFLLWRRRGKPAPSGESFAIYLVLAGLARFAVEFVRINPRGALGLSEAQWTSVVIVVCGGFLLARTRVGSELR